MTSNLRVGDTFPDIELPNHQNEPTRLSQLTRPSLLDEKLSFLDGYPLILVFYRGFFCPTRPAADAAADPVPERTGGEL